MGIKADRAFTKIYKKDPAGDRYMIEVAMANYADIFNKWDSAPITRREVDPDLGHYLERCSEEIPFPYPIGLYIAVPSGMRDPDQEISARKGIESHYAFKIYLLKKELNRNGFRTLGCALLGSFLLGLAVLYPDASPRLLPSIFDQALLIGGWIFLWEAISSLVFTNRDLYHRYRIYNRLRQAPINFQDAEALSVI